jgi:hypothetical protein
MSDNFLSRLPWLEDANIRPYVFLRPENRIRQPGVIHSAVNWFSQKPLYKNPIAMAEVDFADLIYELEGKAFGQTGMAMPRWVFYDCAIIPGFVAGFAAKTESLPDSVRKVLTGHEDCEWTPLSLFITIPTMGEKEWVAHNLCSINSLIPKESRYYGLGFMTKAFGLWYANVEILCGITQWGSPAIRLHSHYGYIEILTAYTPVHSYARTLTYRAKVRVENWPKFFTHKDDPQFDVLYEDTGIIVDPSAEDSLKSLQNRLEAGEGPFFLNAKEVKLKGLNDPQNIYRPKPKA